MTAHLKILCALSIAVGLMRLLVPGGKYKKAYTAFCGVLMLYAMIMPVAELKGMGEMFELKGEKEISQSLSQSGDTLQNSINESLLSQSLTAFMNEKGYDVTVSVTCRTEKDSLTVERLTVEGELSFGERSEISELLSESVSFDCEVIFKGDEHEGG